MSVLPRSLSGAPHYDIIVVGGGINGGAIAREAALSGYRVKLLERDDLCSGTSAAATRLIHGGLRYLEYAQIGLVYESLHERENLLRTAGHLVSPLPIYIPIYSDARRGRWQVSLGLGLYDLLSLGKSVPSHRMLRRDQFLETLPGLQADGLVCGASYYDAQVSWPERLVVELCADAAAHGAEIHTHTPVTNVITAGGQVWGVEYRDGAVLRSAAATVVVNAAGPWVDRVAMGHAGRRLIGGTRGSHLVVRPVAGLPQHAIYVEAASDGRPFFIVPWNGLLLIGTTDVRFDGDPSNVTLADEETQWLLSETRRLFPQAGAFEEQVCYGYSGIRPLPFRPDGSPGAITRRHLVHAHTRAEGLFSVIGGKLTTHRALAEDVLRAVRRLLPRLRRSEGTRARALPGMLDADDRAALEVELRNTCDDGLAQRLLNVYGGTAAEIIALAEASPELAMVLGPGSKVLVSELCFAFDQQWSRTLTDFLQRRCMSGLDADRGLRDAEFAATWLVRLGYFDRDAAQQQLSDYRSWLRVHRPIPGALQPRK